MHLKEKITCERLRWACRRGMLELDLFLLPFWEAQREGLTQQEKEDLIELLKTSDPELLSWLMGYTVPENKESAALVDKIRTFKRKERL